jgi:hypothetical protein
MQYIGWRHRHVHAEIYELPCIRELLPDLALSKSLCSMYIDKMPKILCQAENNIRHPLVDMVSTMIKSIQKVSSQIKFHTKCSKAWKHYEAVHLDIRPWICPTTTASKRTKVSAHLTDHVDGVPWTALMVASYATFCCKGDGKHVDTVHLKLDRINVHILDVRRCSELRWGDVSRKHTTYR